MVLRAKGFLASVFASALLFVGLAAPASGQQQGLVNVNVEDVTVVVPINAAANICGVDVTVIALAFAPIGKQTFTDCDARGNQTVTVSER
jgi:hypothetical protein